MCLFNTGASNLINTSSFVGLQALDRWEERLEALFEGRPYDELDATLTDTLSQFPVDIQPFRWVGAADAAGPDGLIG